jgi:hypothetical protein
MFLEMIQSPVRGLGDADDRSRRQEGVQEAPTDGFPREVALLDNDEHPAEGHQGRGTVVQVQCAGEIIEEVGRVQKQAFIPHRGDQEVQADEPEPQHGQ